MKELSMHIMDIAQNSIRAEASHIRIEIKENIGPENKFIIGIEGNCTGISPENINKASDLFYTTIIKKTGMGLALLEQNAGQADGDMNINSTEGKGRTIITCFCHDHLGRQPLEDIALTITGFIRMNPTFDFVFTHTFNNDEFKIDTRIIKEEIGNAEINDGRVINF